MPYAARELTTQHKSEIRRELAVAQTVHADVVEDQEAPPVYSPVQVRLLRALLRHPAADAMVAGLLPAVLHPDLAPTFALIADLHSRGVRVDVDLLPLRMKEAGITMPADVPDLSSHDPLEIVPSLVEAVALEGAERVTRQEKAQQKIDAEFRDKVDGKKVDLRALSVAKEELEAERGGTHAPSWVDVTAAMAGGIDRPMPTLARRTDGVGLIYRGKDTVVIAPPESAKTLLLTHAAVEVLDDGGSVGWIDTDHNGVETTIARLIEFGADIEALQDPNHFRLAVIDDGLAELMANIADLVAWKPDLAILDSLGEIVPMFDGASSNDADDFRRVHRKAVKPLLSVGSAVLAVDHPPKSVEAGSYGSAGTYAKLAVITGVMLRMVPFQDFIPGKGGAARLKIVKDRPGSLRAESPGTGEQVAALFRVDSASRGTLYAPSLGGDQPQPYVDEDSKLEADVAKVALMAASDRTVVKAKAFLNCGQARAQRALDAYRLRNE